MESKHHFRNEFNAYVRTPIMHTEGFLPKESCEDLMYLLEEEYQKTSKINPVFEVDDTYGENKFLNINTRTYWMNSDHRVVRNYTEIMCDALLEANAENFRHPDPFFSSSLFITEYLAGEYRGEHIDGGYFDPERDGISHPLVIARTRQRRMTAIVLLTDENSFEGGDLMFPEYYSQFMKRKMEPKWFKQGDLVIFDAQVLHSVTEVLSGVRMSLVHSLYNDWPYA